MVIAGSAGVNPPGYRQSLLTDHVSLGVRVSDEVLGVPWVWVGPSVLE